MNEVRFLRLVNGHDVVAEVVTETKTTITLKSAMALETQIDIDEGKQSIIMYPWMPHGVLIEDETKLYKRDVLTMGDIEEDIKGYYIENCVSLFGKQKMVNATVAGGNHGTNVLNFQRPSKNISN